ncbi:MmpS family transport accessory protein [Mycolicibacterium thermoresistibile]
MTENSGFPPYPPPHGAPGQFGPLPGHPYPPPSPYSAPPTKRRWPWIVAAIAAVIVLTTGAIAALLLVGADDEEDIATVVVTYEVTGPPGTTVELTYWTSDNAQSEVQTVTLPWRTQVTKGGDNTYVSISVLRPERSDEPLGCRITADDVTISEDESVGISTSCGGQVGGEN